MHQNENEAKEEVLRISGVDVLKCMKCGKCTATCPSYDEMEYHPHQFVYMVEHGEIEKLRASASVYKCFACFACIERCPRQVEPAKLIEAIRLLNIREQGNNHLHTDDIRGKLNEDLPQQAIVAALRKYSK